MSLAGRRTCSCSNLFAPAELVLRETNVAVYNQHLNMKIFVVIAAVVCSAVKQMTGCVMLGLCHRASWSALVRCQMDTVNTSCHTLST